MVERFKIKPGSLGGWNTYLKGVIERECVAQNKEARGDRGPRDSMYASDYGQCQRKTFMQFFPDRFPGEKFTDRTIRIFQNGDSVHERLSEYLRRDKALGFLEEIDIPRDTLDVHGRSDGLCLINDQFVVVEFKSINRSNVPCPKEEHLGQITMYMMMWDEYRGDLRQLLGLGRDEIPSKDFDTNHFKRLTREEILLVSSQGPIKGELIYESKQTQAVFCFPVDLEQGRVSKVRLWYEQMHHFVDNEQMPEMRNVKDKFPCQWGRGSTLGKCQFYDTCWNGGLKEVDDGDKVQITRS